MFQDSGAQPEVTILHLGGGFSSCRGTQRCLVMYVPCGGTRHSIGTVEMLLECVNILLSLRKQNLKPFPQPHILLQFYHSSSFQQNSSV